MQATKNAANYLLTTTWVPIAQNSDFYFQFNPFAKLDLSSYSSYNCIVFNF